MAFFGKKNRLPDGSSGRNLAGTETDLFGLLVLIKRKSLQKMRSSYGKILESPGWSDWKKRRRNRHIWLVDLKRPALKHDVTSQREKTANLIPRSKFRHPVFAFARELMTLKNYDKRFDPENEKFRDPQYSNWIKYQIIMPIKVCGEIFLLLSQKMISPLLKII